MRAYTILLIVAWLFVIVFNNVPGTLEGYLFPVVTEFKIEEVSQDSRVRGTFLKMRECQFREVTWYLTDGETKIPVSLTFEDGPKIRHEGRESYGPWHVGIPSDRIRSESYVVVEHRCHPLWPTKTKLYPTK